MSSWRKSSLASSARSALGSALLAACLASTAHAEPELSGPEETCPEGSVWHEEAEPERHAVGELIPGRVGWCQQGDKKHGPMRLWWKSGALMREVHFEAGAETGRLTSFFPDGRPEVETRQRDGRVEGRFVLWHKTGKRARDMAYEGGRPHGYATYWDEDGQVLSRGAWVDGKKEGVWETFHKNGVLKEMARWESGRLAGRQLVFSEGGRFVSGACWQEGERRWESKNEAETRTRKCHPW